MKKILLIILCISFLLGYSQRIDTPKTPEINWLTLEKAQEYAKKYDRNILIYFYKKDCPYCDQMKNETFKDIKVVNRINYNFFPVKINSRTKDTIYYNGKAYSNQQPIEKGSTWPHEFYREVARYQEKNGKDASTTPTIVVFNNKFEKINVIPGLQTKLLLFRRLKSYIK